MVGEREVQECRKAGYVRQWKFRLSICKPDIEFEIFKVAMYYGMKLRKTYQQNIIVLRGLSKGVKSLSTAQPVMATNVPGIADGGN